MSKYSLATFVQPSLRCRGVNSPLFMDRICAVLKATPKELRNHKNNPYAARRRWAISYVMANTKKREIAEIGLFLQCHVATIRNGLERAEALIANDDDFASMVDALEVVA